MKLTAAQLAGIEIRSVLAGAYRGRDISARALHTHAVVEGAASSLCKRIDDGHLCDINEGGEPTCPECVRRLAKARERAANESR
jgi:hypothetical protein